MPVGETTGIGGLQDHYHYFLEEARTDISCSANLYHTYVINNNRPLNIREKSQQLFLIIQLPRFDNSVA